MKNLNTQNGISYALLSIILWSTSATVGKLLLTTLSAFQVLFYTSLIASTSLFVILIAQNKLPILKTLTFKDYIHFAYMGTLGVFLYYFFYFSALKYTTAQEAFIINYTWPIWIIIFATFILKESLTIKKIFAIILSFLGVMIIISKGQLTQIITFNLKGYLFAFLGAISYGLFSVLGKKSNYDRFVSMFFYYFFSFGIISLLSITNYYNIPSLSIKETLGVLWLGIFTSGLAFVFWFLALKTGKIQIVSNLVFLTPFLSLLWIFLILKEQFYLSSLIGLGFIFIGIIIQSKN